MKSNDGLRPQRTTAPMSSNSGQPPSSENERGADKASAPLLPFPRLPNAEKACLRFVADLGRCRIGLNPIPAACD
jgi:hypothetical protein